MSVDKKANETDTCDKATSEMEEKAEAFADAQQSGPHQSTEIWHYRKFAFQAGWQARDEEVRVLREALEVIQDEAKRSYDNDILCLMNAPAGNPNNCWSEHNKHTQTFSWIVARSRQALEASGDMPQAECEHQWVEGYYQGPYGTRECGRSCRKCYAFKPQSPESGDTCPHCKAGTLQAVAASEPWSPEHLICDACGSTYAL